MSPAEQYFNSLSERGFLRGNVFDPTKKASYYRKAVREEARGLIFYSYYNAGDDARTPARNEREFLANNVANVMILAGCDLDNIQQLADWATRPWGTNGAPSIVDIVVAPPLSSKRKTYNENAKIRKMYKSMMMRNKELVGAFDAHHMMDEYGHCDYNLMSFEERENAQIAARKFIAGFCD